jgi:hypothetical protein
LLNFIGFECFCKARHFFYAPGDVHKDIQHEIVK